MAATASFRPKGRLSACHGIARSPEDRLRGRRDRGTACAWGAITAQLSPLPDRRGKKYERVSTRIASYPSRSGAWAGQAFRQMSCKSCPAAPAPIARVIAVHCSTVLPRGHPSGASARPSEGPARPLIRLASAALREDMSAQQELAGVTHGRHGSIFWGEYFMAVTDHVDLKPVHGRGLRNAILISPNSSRPCRKWAEDIFEFMEDKEEYHSQQILRRIARA